MVIDWSLKGKVPPLTPASRLPYPLRGAGATANGLSHRRLPVSRSAVLVVTALMSKAVALAVIGVSKNICV